MPIDFYEAGFHLKLTTLLENTQPFETCFNVTTTHNTPHIHTLDMLRSLVRGYHGRMTTSNRFTNTRFTNTTSPNSTNPSSTSKTPLRTKLAWFFAYPLLGAGVGAGAGVKAVLTRDTINPPLDPEATNPVIIGGLAITGTIVGPFCASTLWTRDSINEISTKLTQINNKKTHTIVDTIVDTSADLTSTSTETSDVTSK